MEENDARRIRDLLTSSRVLSLGVLVEGEPYIGLLPYALRPDFGAAVVQASRMARHARGLLPGARFSALFHEPDRPGADPLQIPRLTIQGAVHPLLRDTPKHAEGKRLLVARFPEAEPLFSFDDFELYELRFHEGRYVGGFGRALHLFEHTLRLLATSG